MKRWAVSVFYMGTIETEIITADTWQQAVYQHSHSGCFPSIEQCRQYWPNHPDEEAFKESSQVHVTWVEIPDFEEKLINRVKNAADRLRASSLLEDTRRVLYNEPPAKLGHTNFHRVAEWVSEAIDLLGVPDDTVTNAKKHGVVLLQTIKSWVAVEMSSGSVLRTGTHMDLRNEMSKLGVTVWAEINSKVQS